MKVISLLTEEILEEVPSLTDYLLHKEQKNMPYVIRTLHKSSTLQPAKKRMVYVPHLDTLEIKHPERATSVVINWTDLEEDTLYMLDDKEALKLRITNPKMKVLYITANHA